MLTVLALALSTAAASPPAEPVDPDEGREFPIAPLQADLSVSFGSPDPRGPLAGALYVGAALGWVTNGRSPSFFSGAGLEIVYCTADDPYRMAVGAQLRAGLAWAQQRGFNTVAIPDLLVFLRLSLFGAGYVTRVTTPGGMMFSSSNNFFGVRAGLGLTALWLPRMFFEHFPLFDVDGPWGEVLKVLNTLLLFPLTLVNHGEVAFELALAPRALTTVVFRVGTGF